MKTDRLIYTLLFLLFGIQVKAQVPSYVPLDSIQAWYSLDGNGNNAVSVLKNGNIVNASAGANRYNAAGKAMVFLSDTTSMVEIPDGAGYECGSSHYSYSVWIKPGDTAFAAFPVRPILNYFLAVDMFSFAQLDTHVVQLYISRDFFFSYTLVDTTLSKDWTHYVICSNDTSLQLYKNGKFLTETPYMPSTNTGTLRASLNIGGGGTAAFRGSVDDVGIWKKCLTANEIDQLYKATLTSVRNQQSPEVLRLFPNPVQNKLEINGLKAYASYEYQMTDLTGKVVQEGSVNGNAASLDLSNLNKGIYVLQLQGKAYKIVKE